MASIAVGAAVFLALAYFALVSWREEERRAAKRAAALALLLPWPYIGSGLIDLSLHTPLSLLVLGASIFAALLVWFPRRSACDPVDDTPRARIDERDIMFSRNLLQPGTARFDQYYTANPEKR
ncbi:MAG: hypothetical protein JXB35_11180, partial [Anaerolineae bacterium]|nr:hypothetical protein [Anaerolineae bacterium]